MRPMKRCLNDSPRTSRSHSTASSPMRRRRSRGRSSCWSSGARRRPGCSMMRIMAGPRMTMNIEGKMQPTSGKSILMGALAAISSARWRRSMRSCSDWTSRTLAMATPSCSAWMMAPMKLVRAGTLVRPTISLRASRRGLADPDLGQRSAELVGQRALGLLDDLAQRGIEAEAGLDRDGEQVEHVRDGQQDGLLARLDACAEPVVGHEEAQ